MESIDYVITHELCHLLIPSHSRDFYELQESVMPDWERRKQRLERIMAWERRSTSATPLPAVAMSPWISFRME